MESKKLKILKDKFNKITDEYLQAFIKKQGCVFDYWIADEIGGIASFNEQHYFNLDDIRMDINLNAPKHLIFQWQDDCVDAQPDDRVNYRNYIKGVRPAKPGIDLNTYSTAAC